jgi:undecaprenyl-diphosphatase
VPAGLLFIAIAFVDWEVRPRPGRARLAFLFSQAGYAFLAVAFAGIIGDIFKFLVGRARPKLFDDGGSLHFEPFTAAHDFNSFPSGHSTTMGAVAMMLMIWFPRARVPIFLLCAFLAVTRVAARAHYPSDVVAGFSLGLLYALFLARWLARRRVAFRFKNNALLPAPRFRPFVRIDR